MANILILILSIFIATGNGFWGNKAVEVREEELGKSGAEFKFGEFKSYEKNWQRPRRKSENGWERDEDLLKESVDKIEDEIDRVEHLTNFCSQFLGLRCI